MNTPVTLTSSPKKLLFTIFSLGYGGAEKVLVNLVNSLDHRKYDITILTIYNYGVNLKNLARHVKVKYIFNCKPIKGMNLLLRILSPTRLYNMAIKEHYDVEIAYLEGLPTRILGGGRRPGVKRLAWVHGEVYDSFFNAFRSKTEALKCYSNFDSVTFVSDSARKYFLKVTGWTLSTEVIYNVLETDKIKRLSLENIEIDLAKDKINICCVGKLSEGKGVDRLVKALGRVRQTGKANWHLYLLGEGEQRKHIESLIESYHISDNVTLLGYQTNPYKYVSRMDLLVCPSYREALSTAVSEAVVVNTPFLTTDCSGMREILGDSGAGIIVENSEDGLFNGLYEICDHPEKLVSMKEQARLRADFFSTETRIRQFEEYIRR